MRHTSTLLSSIFLVASLAASTAHAANSVIIASSTCAGNEVRSFTGDATFTCSGDYYFLSGSIEWDTNISITANGSLYFDDFAIKGNRVEVISPNRISFTARTLIQVSITTMDSSNLGNQPPPYFIFIPADSVSTGDRGVNSVVREAGNVSLGAGGLLIGDTRVQPVVPELRKIILRAGGDFTLNAGAISVGTGPGAILVNTGSGFFRDVPVISAVPEPEAYAMLLAGLGLIGTFVGRRKLNLTT